MPELPDLEMYRSALEPRIVGRRLDRVEMRSPFLLRTVDPPVREAEGKLVRGVRRLGKRIVIAMEADLFLVIHLMIAGRFRWGDRAGKSPGKIALAAFLFDSGTLWLTEAASKKRASLHLARGEAGLAALDPGGIEVLVGGVPEFRAALRRENHTLKRALTDPRLFSGIGNAYSDEILHRARMSPAARTERLDDDEIARLFEAVHAVLSEWIARLRREAGDGFPERVTAFREEMAVHGRYGLPCPACGARVQRIVYAGNEANYCARCQTGGKVLADRALSRLLKGDWPRTLEELEAVRASRTPSPA